MSRIGGAIRDKISIENDSPRVSVRERGRPSFLVLLNARDPTPGHSYLRLLRRKCLLPSAPRVRLRTLNRTSYESRNAMTNVPAAARAASALRNFSIWGPPIESSAARARNASQSILLRLHARRLVNAILTNICSIVTNTIPHPAEPGRIVRVCPTYLRFQNAPNRRNDSGYNSYRKRRTPRKYLGARATSFRRC